MLLRRLGAFAALVVLVAMPSRAAAWTVHRTAPAAFKASTELVLVNVVVRDRTGAVVRGLTKDDFTVTEDEKAQVIQTSTSRSLGRHRISPRSMRSGCWVVPEGGALIIGAPPHRAHQPPVRRTAARPPRPPAHRAVLRSELDADRGARARRRCGARLRDEQLSPADLVAVASFSTALRVDQDFTADRSALGAALDGFDAAGGQGFEEGTTGDSRARRTTARRSPSTTPSSTSSTPTGASRRCRRCPTRCRASIRRSRSSTSAAA